jgi:hypothetical protein
MPRRSLSPAAAIRIAQAYGKYRLDRAGVIYLTLPTRARKSASRSMRYTSTGFFVPAPQNGYGL